MNKNVSKKFSIMLGGVSCEHNASLSSFAHVYTSLKENVKAREHYENVYFIDRTGEVRKNRIDFNKYYNYYLNEYEAKMSLVEAIAAIKQNGEFVFSLLHGQLGEDGHFPGMARVMGVAGSFGSVLSCSMSMSKYHASQFVAATYPQIKPIPTQVITDLDLPLLRDKLKPLYGSQVVVKPNSLGASLFTRRLLLDVDAVDQMVEAVNTILKYDSMALIQPYIPGDEFSCGCLEIKNKVLVLPLVHIVTADGFFGHEEKHRQGKASEILVPESAYDKNLNTIREVSRAIFIDLMFENMCRFDYIVSDDKVYFLEINPLPGLMKNSLFPKMLRGLNLEVYELFDIFFENSLNRKSKETWVEYEID